MYYKSLMEQIALERIIDLGEDYHLELKEAVDKSLIEEICAFANSSGGRIILGVTDSGEIKGIDTSNSIRSRIQDIMKGIIPQGKPWTRDAKRPFPTQGSGYGYLSFPTLARKWNHRDGSASLARLGMKQLEPSLSIELIISMNLIILEVPKGEEKPYGCSRGFFVRIGPNTQKLTRNEIVSFFEKEGRVRFDELENRKADFETDFDEKAYNSYLKIAGITQNIDSDLLLKNLDCLNIDNKLTNAGVLFFTKSTEFNMMQATVVCVLYKGTKKLHVLDKKDFNTNIIENIENAILFVKRHTNLSYRIEHIQREEIPEIPEVALREAVINAVCHRDYFVKGANVMVEVFDDRVEISNPGSLPSDLAPEDFGKKSVTRNPVIASLLHRIDYIERIGTGIQRIKDAVEEHESCMVEFNLTNFFTVVFTRSGINPDAVEQKTSGNGELNGEIQTTSGKTSGKIISMVKNNPQITIPEMSKQIGVTERSIERNIKKLQQEYRLKRIGPAKGGYWMVTDE